MTPAGRRRLTDDGVLLCRSYRRYCSRQVDRECGAFAEFAHDSNIAIGLLGKAKCLAEAQPGSLSNLLGRKERLEDRGESFRRDACSAILDRNGDESTAPDTLAAQRRNRIDLPHGDGQPAL